MFQTGYESTNASAASRRSTYGATRARLTSDRVIFDPVLPAHHGIEAFRVEIAIVYLMAARA